MTVWEFWFFPHLTQQYYHYDLLESHCWDSAFSITKPESVSHWYPFSLLPFSNNQQYVFCWHWSRIDLAISRKVSTFFFWWNYVILLFLTKCLTLKFQRCGRLTSPSLDDRKYCTLNCLHFQYPFHLCQKQRNERFFGTIFSNCLLLLDPLAKSRKLHQMEASEQKFDHHLK